MCMMYYQDLLTAKDGCLRYKVVRRTETPGVYHPELAPGYHAYHLGQMHESTQVASSDWVHVFRTWRDAQRYIHNKRVRLGSYGRGWLCIIQVRCYKPGVFGVVPLMPSLIGETWKRVVPLKEVR